MNSNRRRPVKLTHRESWFRIENRADDSPVLIHLLDEIGAFGISAQDFVKELNDIKASKIELHISSPGGEVFDGLTMMNALESHPAEVHVLIDGLAASAATVVAMAGDKVSINRHAQMMIHESHAVGVGNAKDMRQLADLLDKCSDTIAGTYADKAGGTVADWRGRMSRETWYTADEAVRAGLADEVIPGRKVRADWNLTIFNYAGRDQAPDPFVVVGETGPETLTLARPVTVSAVTTMLPEPDPSPPAEPEETNPADVPGFVLPDIAGAVRELHEVVFDPAVLFASVQLGVSDVPAPDPPKPEAPADEPLEVIDLPAVRRALKGALL